MIISSHLQKKYNIRPLLLLIAIMVSLISARATSNTYGQLAKLPSETLIEKAKYFLDHASKPDSALICFSIVTSRCQKHMSSKEIEQIAYALNRKWQIYFYSYYNYEKASEELSRALEFCEENNLNKSKILLNFGSMNHFIAEQTGDPSILAITADYYSNAIAEAKSEKAYTVYITALNNLIAIRYRQGDLENLKALSAEVASLSHAPQRPHTTFAYNFYNGVVNLKEGNYDLSMHYFEQISNLFEPSSNNTYYRYMAVEGKALSLAAKGDFKQAIDILLTMEKECLQLDKRDVLLYLYNTLCDLYRRNGMQEKSDEYYKKYLATRDKLISYRQLVSFSDMKFLQQIRNDEQQMAQMQYRQKLSVYGIVILVLVVAIILMLLVLVYRKSRILAQANRDLYLKNEELLANEDKERQQRMEFEQLVMQMKPEDKPKYHTYKLNDEQQQILANKIVNVFENNSEIFEADFSAVRLAELVESPAKDVSKTINMCFNCNFNGMLNKYRVQEACRRISHHTEYANFTIEAIGNSVGYKSRSAFIAAFKHFTGLKPSEYQQMSKEESHQ